jgi:hypothetical protein
MVSWFVLFLEYSWNFEALEKPFKREKSLQTPSLLVLRVLRSFLLPKK